MRSSCFLLLLLLAALPLSAVTVTVTNVNDSGPGSLRQALLDTSGGGGRIEFAIGSGPQTIQPLTKLPSAFNTVIDARTQPGYSGKPIIEIDGSLTDVAFSAGLTIQDGAVYGVVVNNHAGTGIQLFGGTVQNCYVGTDLTGTVARGNETGISVSGSVPRAVIGGSGPNEGNLISGNGLGLSASGSVSIQGNTFGSDVTRTVSLASSTIHLWVPGHSYGAVVVGGEAPNVFVGGVLGVYVSANDSRIVANYFGTTPTGVLLPIGTAVLITDGHQNFVSANVIAGNDRAVVVTGHSLRNQIGGNSMYGNQLGIDLWSDYGPYGPTPNDDGDGDTGPNNLVNFPVLGRTTPENGQTVIRGTLSTLPNRNHHVELFASPTCNASGYGEGRDLIDGFDIATDSSGSASFERTVSTLPAGTWITATATSELEGTSEFSPCAIVEGPGRFAFGSATPSAVEGTAATVTVHRLDGALGVASVTYGVNGGTATADDFTGGNGTLDFADGETTKTFTLPTTGDSVHEGGETIRLALSGATGGATIGTPSTIVVTIVDDDPEPQVTMSDVQVDEGAAGTTVAEVPIFLSHASATPYTVDYAMNPDYPATPGVDYIDESGSVTFAPGETEKRIPVKILGDTLYEQDEYLSVYLRSRWWIRATVRIRNDDPLPVVSVQELRVVEGSGRRTAEVVLRTDVPIYGAFSATLVSGSAHAGTDFVSHSASLYFFYETSKSFVITILGDDEPEPDEQFFVRLRSFTSQATAGPDGIVTIVNDDIGVGPSERAIPAGATGAFTVRLGQAVAQDTVIPIASNASAGIFVPATLLIPAGQSSADFEVTALAPGHNADITLTFPPSLGGATRAVHAYTYAQATLRFSPSRLNVFDGQTATVSVSLDPPSTTPATIGLVSSDRVSVPSSLTIPPGGSASFVVTAKKLGAFTVDAQLPVENGNEIQSLFGDVIAQPTTPTILSITPSHGPTSGGTQVTIGGANLRYGCTVAFGGVAASSVKFTSASSLSATTPPHAAGSVDVLLTCGSDTFTFPDGFGYVTEAPRVSHVSPSSGTTAGGTHVRATGTNFDGSCWLFFGRFAATNVVVRDAESITGVTPAQPAGLSDVTVRCSAGTSTVPLAFTYRSDADPAPLITEVVPSAAAPGELVTIRGLHFRPTDSAAIDTTAAAIVDSSPESHVIRVPELPAGRASVFVSDVLGQTTTSGPLFSVLEARPPRITAVSPMSVPAGGELELSGEGFRPGYTFEIGGLAATIVSSDYTRAIVRVASDVEAGSHAVHVRNRAAVLAAIGPNVEILGDGLVVTAAEPRCTTTDGGVYATIRGSGFTSAANVLFDGAPSAEVVFVDATTLRVQVPPGAAGAARISVIDGTATATLTNGFRYASPFDPHACVRRARTIRP